MRVHLRRPHSAAPPHPGSSLDLAAHHQTPSLYPARPARLAATAAAAAAPLTAGVARLTAAVVLVTAAVALVTAATSGEQDPDPPTALGRAAPAASAAAAAVSGLGSSRRWARSGSGP